MNAEKKKKKKKSESAASLSSNPVIDNESRPGSEQISRDKQSRVRR